MRKFIVAVIVFLVAFAVPVTVYTLVTGSSEEFGSREAAAENGDVSENAAIPQIISMPVTQVEVGDMYSYRVRALDADGDTLEYEARLYPSWMSWDEELQVLDGKPDADDIGLHRVEIVVTDGKWVQTHAFDVSVIDGESESVVPISDTPAGIVKSESEIEPDSTEDGSQIPGGTVSSSPENDTGEVIYSDEYGLTPIDDTVADAGAGIEDSPANPEVLGEATTLPNTATFNGVIAVSLGVAILAMGTFLWSDARWDISSRLLTFLRYERGDQISMDVRTGSGVKKRKVEL